VPRPHQCANPLDWDGRRSGTQRLRARRTGCAMTEGDFVALAAAGG